MLIYDQSRDVTVTMDGVTIERVLRVTPYSDYVTALPLLLGTVVNNNGVLVRTTPASDPHFPYCYCTSVKVKGVGVYGGTLGPDTLPAILATVVEYEQGAELTCSFKTLDYDYTNLLELDLISTSTDVSARQLTLPNQRYKWDGKGQPLLINSNTQASKLIPQMTYELIRKYVLVVPNTAILQLLGRINRFETSLAGSTYPIGTLRFDGLTIRRKLNWQGFKINDMTYKFAVQPVWDKFRIADEIVIIGNMTAASAVIASVATTAGVHAGDAISSTITQPATGNLTTGSAIITGIAPASIVFVGDRIVGPGIQAGTTVLSVDSPTQVTLSKSATVTTTGVAFKAIVFFIPAGTTVLSVDSPTQLTLSAAAAVTMVGAACTVIHIDQDVGYVTWNRLYRPDTGFWEKPVLATDGTTPIYLPDTEITQIIGGFAVSGFDLLFNPGAA